MNYKEIVKFLKQGKIAMLPKYEGYFYWNFGKDCMYFKNKDYIKYNLDKEKKRDDWFYII